MVIKMGTSILRQDGPINVIAGHVDVARIGGATVPERRRAIVMKQPSVTEWGVAMPIVADGQGTQIGI